MSDAEYLAGIRACLEPAAVAATTPIDDQIKLSTALSLKRIADALCGDDQNAGIARTLQFMEKNMGAHQ